MSRDWTLALVAFAGLLTTNVIISLILFWKERSALHRLLALFWIGTTISLVLQGAIASPPETVFGFGIPLFFVNLALADFMRRVLSLRMRWRAYFVIAAVCSVATIACLLAGAPFWLMAMPMAIMITVPLFDVAIQALRRPEELSITTRMMLVAIFLMCLHDLDYPFLRNVQGFAPYAFAIAIVIFFAMAICAPLMILETTAAEVRRLQADAIERERLSALGEASAVLAHEVRNPLGTMTNTTELLAKEPLSDEGRELLAIQRAELLRLDRLVHDLLSFSKPLEPKVTDVEMGSLVRHAMRSVRADAEAGNVALAVAETAERLVRGDADAILMALVNVLRNAIEASPRGGTVRIALGDRDGATRVTIDDEGEGVAGEALERLFEPFFTTRAKGSGLGLAILDRIMKAHGGEVRVRNLPERGARFELVFAR